MPTSDLVNTVRLVVVHGMGSQRSSETLLEWAEPLIRRLEWRVGVGQGIRFDDVRLGVDDDSRVSVSAQYRDEGGRTRILDLTITEARWSESFLAMKRGETFAWGLGFLWRTVGRLGVHFSRNMGLLYSESKPRRPSAEQAADAARWVVWALHLAWSLVVGVIALVLIAALWLLLLVLSLVATVLLLVIGPLLFLPGLGRLLQGIVDTIVDFVGDVAVWTRRPVRAAAMRQAVEKAITAAHDALPDPEDGSGRLIVVAHSEGAAITADLLFNQPDGKQPPKVDALLTVGAAITLLGEARWVATASRPPASAVAAGLARTAAVHNPVGGWSGQGGHRVRWLNFWGIWDPFAAGPISTDAAARRQRWRESFELEGDGAEVAAEGPEEHPLHNTALPLTDHQSYALNVVQVIDPLARLVLDPGTVTAPQGTPAEQGEATRNRLHVEGIRALGLNRLIVLVVAVLSLVVPDFTAGFTEALARRLRWVLGDSADDGVAAWLLAMDDLGRYLASVASVAFAAGGLWLNELLWRRHGAAIAWRRTPRMAELGGSDGEPPLVPELVWWGGVALRGALLGLAVTALGAAGAPTGWLVVAGFFSALLLVVPWLGRVPRVAPARPAARS